METPVTLSPDALTIMDDILARAQARTAIQTMEVTPTKAKGKDPEPEEEDDGAPELYHDRKVYRERGHVLMCMGGLEIGVGETKSTILGALKADYAVLRDTRTGMPVGAIVRQAQPTGTVHEVWPPLFIERTRGKTVGWANAYRTYYENLRDPDFVASEVLALYGRQTEDEQKEKDTKHRNHRGFCAFSGRAGTRIAELVLAGKSLGPKDMRRAVEICLRHRRQVITGQ